MLTGQMWVLKLLAGYPKCIHTQLGVHSHVFYAIIDEPCALCYTDSKFVTLEEQLAIFLYCSVSSLTVGHLGEWFPRSNDTITLWAIFYFNCLFLKFKILIVISRKCWHSLLTTILYKSCDTSKCQEPYPPRDMAESKILALLPRCTGCHWWKSH